ncbi:FAD-dependent oxidoreductase [Lederbergia sp. NSJ-179]|uniref:NAD(P)/FAD-dependent oxidoreductase n=1 Tax=Lederbergia sp. NSJ-179 TaxID=2931402 RepID=UPI001FD33981|nr:FAD-dependent oxidoreductase [Lederbergia sp. NSJ-179]MCJ7841961.1 FAD-dependent oxidoreductase [Lederbergia sp. NSJ-179]
MNIVIVGSGFGGLNAAIEIRKKLKKSPHDVIVISEKAEFVFRPSLIWLPFHKHSINKFTFPLRPTFEKIGVTFIEKRVQAIKPKQNHVICNDNEIIEYDYLILASGASPDWARIKGLEEMSASVYDLSSALQTGKRLEEMEEGEPIVIGVAQENPNPGIAYEFLFELYTYLSGRRIKCPITFFTYEKELFDGKGTEPTEQLEGLMREKQITYHCNVSIKKVDDRKIYLNNGKRLPYSFLLVLPPYKGKEYIPSSKDFKHENGILPVHETLQSVQWENIFVVGDANNIKGTKTGRAAELQGALAAENIIKQMQHEPLMLFQHDTLYIMEIGKEGAMFIMNTSSKPGTLKWTMSGMMPHMLKRAFEKYYLLKFS